jgi:hypothetical protein
MKYHKPTRAYIARRITEGKTKPEIMRCLKRHITREIVTDQTPSPPTQRSAKRHLPSIGASAVVARRRALNRMPRQTWLLRWI